MTAYDRKQGYPDPSEDLAIFETHGLGADSTIVDFGAGTGQFALPAARRFGRVIAVDVSPEMVAVLRGRAAQAAVRRLHVRHEGVRFHDRGIPGPHSAP